MMRLGMMREDRMEGGTILKDEGVWRILRWKQKMFIVWMFRDRGGGRTGAREC